MLRSFRNGKGFRIGGRIPCSRHGRGRRVEWFIVSLVLSLAFMGWLLWG